MNKIEYTWIRSDRKTMVIQVKENGEVIVRTSKYMSKDRVEHFIEEKREWIFKVQKKVLEKRKKEQMISPEERKSGMELAKRIIQERVKYFAKIMNVDYGRITVREQKTRWGSCSSQGNLSFNWKLVRMPKEILDYVVVHELAHRKEMNHSRQFWKIVESVLPDYRDRRKFLKDS